MDYKTDGSGYANAGAWRFPGGSSTDAFYAPRAYDAELLKKAAKVPGASGLLDAAIEDKQEILDGLLKGFGGDRGGSGGSGSVAGGVSGKTGIGIGSLTDSINANALSQAASAGIGKNGQGLMAALQGPVGLAMGLGKAGMAYGSAVNDSNAAVLGLVNSSNDPIGALAAMQGWTNIDPGFASGLWGGSANGGVNAGSLAAANASNDPLGALIGLEGWNGGGSFGGGSDGGGGQNSDGSSGPGDSDGRSSGGGMGVDGMAEGGPVTKDRLHGPNPKGKDDGFAALDVGEYVIKADTAKRLGAKALKALNEGRAEIVMKGSK